ncbi:hypothetical protein N665_0215s0012 [Sinapis alba]|nr:hypothetical protein N665_0215s0012 [Sinapis alba]
MQAHGKGIQKNYHSSREILSAAGHTKLWPEPEPKRNKNKGWRSQSPKAEVILSQQN